VAAMSERRLETVCLAVLAAVAIGAAMYWLRPVLIPFVLAVFLTYSLSPIIDLLTMKCRVPRPVAIVITALVGCLVLIIAGVMISGSVSQMSAHADVYQTRIRGLLEEVSESLPLERLGIEDEDVVGSMVQASQTSVRNFLTGTVGAVMNTLSNGLLVVIYMIFMIVGTGGGSDRPEGVWRDVQRAIRRFIATKVVVPGITGILVGVTLAILGVEFATLFGMLAFLLNFIPSIGSVIATLLPIPVVFLNADMSVVAKILAIAIPGALQFSVGNIIEPRIMGGSLDLHPVTVLLALIFFGMLWGIVGMFLATPITAVVKMMLERIPFTAPVSEMLAGRLPEMPSAETGRTPGDPVSSP
jgi:AI-2 transport protein TqsA